MMWLIRGQVKQMMSGDEGALVTENRSVSHASPKVFRVLDGSSDERGMMFTNTAEEALVLMHYQDWLRETESNGYFRNAELSSVQRSVENWMSSVSDSARGLVCRFESLQTSSICAVPAQ